MVFLEQETIIQAPQEEIVRAAFEVEYFPSFMEDVREVTIVERHGNRQISAWKVEIDGIELSWMEEDLLSLSTCRTEDRLLYRLVQGDFERFEGAWHFSKIDPQGNTTRVRLEVQYDLGLPQFDELIGEVLRLKVERNARSLLQALKERMEGNR